jgi:hypothetical protein
MRGTCRRLGFSAICSCGGIAGISRVMEREASRYNRPKVPKKDTVRKIEEGGNPKELWFTNKNFWTKGCCAGTVGLDEKHRFIRRISSSCESVWGRICGSLPQCEDLTQFPLYTSMNRTILIVPGAGSDLRGLFQRTGPRRGRY